MNFKSVIPVLIAALALAVPVALVAQGNHEHQHEPAAGAAAVTQLQMNAGQKWPTDAPLRTGMQNIRGAFDADHPAIHAGKQTDAQYDALAGRVEQEVNSIVAKCKLPPDADANLHFVVADLLQSVSLMRGQDSARTRHDGAALVHRALNAYGQYFDDPSWPQGADGAMKH